MKPLLAAVRGSVMVRTPPRGRTGNALCQFSKKLLRRVLSYGDIVREGGLTLPSAAARNLS